MEATLETKAETILEFVHGLRGSVRVGFGEGTCGYWLHDLLRGARTVGAVLLCGRSLTRLHCAFLAHLRAAAPVTG
jgi:hypothetical protein